MHRYRAILIDPGNLNQERPIQIYGNDRAEIDRWSNLVLNQAISPEAVVKVYQEIESLIASIPKPKPVEIPRLDAAKAATAPDAT